MDFENSKRYFLAASIIGIVIACIALIDRLYSTYLVVVFSLIEATSISYLIVGFAIYTVILVMSIKGLSLFKKPLESYDDMDFQKNIKNLQGYSITYFVMAAYIFIGVLATLALNEDDLELYAWILNAVMIISFIGAGTLAAASKKPIIENINNFLTAKRNAAATENLFNQGLYSQNTYSANDTPNQNNDPFELK